MSTFTSGTNPKRRPTTYGKPSRRVLTEFRGSSPHEELEEDHKVACGQETLVGRVRKTPLALSAKGLAHPSSNASARDEGTSEHISPAQPTTTNHSRTSDLFDVPSSDEGRPKVQMKPVVKRRKLQAKYTNQVANDAKSQTTLGRKSLNATQKGHPLSSLDIHDATKAQKGQFIGQSNPEVLSRHRILHRKVQSDSSEPVMSEGSDTSYRSEKLLSYQRPQAAVSTGIMDRMGRRKSNSGISEKFPQATSLRNRCPADNLSLASPKTPPRELGQGSSDIPKKYLSPSGLDIPGLVISNTPLASAKKSCSTRSTNLLNQTTVVQEERRAKLKDRLATRDGLCCQDELHSENEESIDERSSTSDDLDSTRRQVRRSGLVSRRGSPLHLEDESAKPRDNLTFSHQRQHHPTTGPKHTYAAVGRTFRKDDCADEALLDISLETEAPPTKQRRLDISSDASVLQSRADVDTSDDDQGQKPPVRTIHELRQAGGNARFWGQAETIIDDIGSNNVSLKRNGLLELESKLEDAKFRSYFVTNGLVGQLLSRKPDCADVLTKTLLSIVTLQVLSYDGSSQTLAVLGERSFMRFYDELLSTNTDIKGLSKTRSVNSAKVMQKAIENVYGKLLNSQMWRCGTPCHVTPRIVSLQCLEYIVRYLREAGAIQELLEQVTVARLVSILSLSTSSIDLAIPTDDFVELKLVLSILESATLYSHRTDAAIEEHWADQSVQTIARFMKSIDRWRPGDSGQVWSLTLRLGLNLTTRSPAFSRIFALEGVIGPMMTLIDFNFRQSDLKPSKDSQCAETDNLVLALGLLINLAENAEDRKLFVTQHNNSLTPLECMLGLFKPRWQQAFESVSEADSQKNVPVGFLAALLAYLCIDLSTRALVASKLEGNGLEHLLIAVYEFIRIYNKLDEESSINDDSTFAGKLRKVANQLKDESGV